MPASLTDRPPPARLRAQTHVTGPRKTHNLVRMRTQLGGWNREAFFAWLDQRIKVVNPPIPDMQTLADMSKISHSALSNWRSGKYKPSLESLAALAPVLKVAKEYIWARAGLVSGDLREMITEEDHAGLDVIETSNLDRDAKDKLKVMYLARIIRDREERMRQLREQIDLLDRG